MSDTEPTHAVVKVEPVGGVAAAPALAAVAPADHAPTSPAAGATPRPAARPSGGRGWEALDTGLSVAGSAARGVGWLVIRIYALFLLLVGVLVLFKGDGASRLAGFPVIGYAIYLMMGGSWIIY